MIPSVSYNRTSNYAKASHRLCSELRIRAGLCHGFINAIAALLQIARPVMLMHMYIIQVGSDHHYDSLFSFDMEPSVRTVSFHFTQISVNIMDGYNILYTLAVI